MTKAETAQVLAEFDRLGTMLERIEAKLDQSLRRLEAIERRLAGDEQQTAASAAPQMVSKLVH